MWILLEEEEHKKRLEKPSACPGVARFRELNLVISIDRSNKNPSLLSGRETRAGKERTKERTSEEPEKDDKCLHHGIHPPAELEEEPALGWFCEEKQKRTDVVVICEEKTEKERRNKTKKTI